MLTLSNDRRRFLPLMALLALLFALHIGRLPVWLAGVLAAFVIWRLVIVLTGRHLPSRWILVACAVPLMLAVFVRFQGVPGRDGSVALLCGLTAVKLMESENRRDALLLIHLGYFLVATHFLFEQGILLSALLFLIALALLVLQVAWQSSSTELSPEKARVAVRTVVTLLMQGVPLILILFVLFPRIDGPLWRLPIDRNQAHSGLSDVMSPGSFSSLAQDTGVAFRVEFPGPKPSESQLYWRGPVFERYDGTSWYRPPRDDEPTPVIVPRGPRWQYWVTLEPQGHQWLLALDAPLQAPAGAHLSNRWQLVLDAPATKRQRYALQSATDFQANSASPDLLERNLVLPTGINPRATALGASWASLAPRKRVDAGLRKMGQLGLQYTLEPPLYRKDPVDEFLFSGHAGFCEHFAGAFVWLMRSAGIPARVVAGYQGGEQNGSYLIVRQSDAHAWAEVWIAPEGWQRVDPTFAVAPARIEHGIGLAVPEKELPYLLRSGSEFWRGLSNISDSVVFHWNQWVIGFSPARQQDLLHKMGFSDGWSSNFLLGLLGMLAVLATGIGGWLIWQARPRSPDPAMLCWRTFCATLRRAGVPVRDADAPFTLLARAVERWPEQGEGIEAFVDSYLHCRYGQVADKRILHLRHQLRDLIRQLSA